jgi:hypothetical protein
MAGWRVEMLYNNGQWGRCSRVFKTRKAAHSALADLHERDRENNREYVYRIRRVEGARPMLKRTLPTWRSLEEMLRRDEYEGWCVRCGEIAYGVEPDARRSACEACDAPSVYGAEELLIRGWFIPDEPYVTRTLGVQGASE